MSYHDSDVARFLSIDPWQAKYPAWSTYNYVMCNPVIFIDPTGKGVESTDVIKNQDGSYTVVNAKNDNDYGVYEVDENGTRKGGPIAYTMLPFDFMLTNNVTGEMYFKKDETGITFNLNNLTISGTVSPRKGYENSIYNADGNELLKWAEQLFKQELDERYVVGPLGALRVLKALSQNKGALDLKVSLGKDANTALQFGTINGLPRITTLRAIGNMAFGSNFESIYSQMTVGGLNKKQYYKLVMMQVGDYNQSQNEGNGYNSGYPYYGEHTYSGNYIYYGYWGFFNCKK